MASSGPIGQGMRRFSSAAAAVATPASAGSRLQRLFRQEPLSDLVELRTIRVVQRIAELPVEAATSSAASISHEKFSEWARNYESTNALEPSAPVTKERFEALMRDSAAYLQSVENDIWQANTLPKIGLLEDEALPQYVSVLQTKLARHKCQQMLSSFAQLDSDNDGQLTLDEVQKLLDVIVRGDNAEWLRCQFQLHDADKDDKVTETETTNLLNWMIATQKAVLTEIFSLHVENMPKNHLKLLEKSMNETNWNAKIPEKARCVFHFGDTEGAEKAKTLQWEAFQESQEAEMPELHNLVAVYAKGFYDERFTFYERKQEKRNTRLKGLFLAFLLGLGDYVATVV